MDEKKTSLLNRSIIESSRDERERKRVIKCRSMAMTQQQQNIHNTSTNYDMPLIPNGFGVATLSKVSFTTLKQLHNRILANLQSRIYWSSYPRDPRQRCYGMLKSSKLWNHPNKLTQEGIAFHDEGVPAAEGEQIHQYTVDHCCVVLDDLNNQEVDSINEVISKTNEILLSYQQVLQDYEVNAVTLDNLVAIQPNLHNGADYLPLHLDCPRNDGFGVVVVTVAIEESADIVLVDDGDDDDMNSSSSSSSNRSSSSSNEKSLTINFDDSHHSESIMYSGSTAHSSNLGLSSQSPPSVTTASTSQMMSKPHASNYDAESSFGLDRRKKQQRHGTTRCSSTYTNKSEITSSNKINNNNNNTTNSNNNTNNTNNCRPKTQCWTFPLHEGDMYVLSGDSRNKCAHGVIVQSSGFRRQSQAETLAQEQSSLPSPLVFSPEIKRIRRKKQRMDDLYTTMTSSSEEEEEEEEVVVTSSASIVTPMVKKVKTIRKSYSSVAAADSSSSSSSYTGLGRIKECHRQSLNFRFGVHTKTQAWESIDRHWKEDNRCEE